MKPKPKRSVLSEMLGAASKVGLEALSTTLVDLLPNSSSLTEKDKRRLRRVARKGISDTAKTVANAARTVAKKAKSKRPPKTEPPLELSRLQIITACRVLTIPVPEEGQLVDLEGARRSKLIAAKLFHPDVAGETKRDQFEVVVQAYKTLEKYNEQLTPMDKFHGPYCREFEVRDQETVYCAELAGHNGEHYFDRAH